jgi:hypothetical protein
LELSRKKAREAAEYLGVEPKIYEVNEDAEIESEEEEEPQV